MKLLFLFFAFTAYSQQTTSELINNAFSAEEEGDYARAVSLLDQAQKREPENETVYYNRGNVYNKMELYEKAVKDLEKATVLNPKDHEAYNNLALNLKELTRYAEAIAALDKAIILQPEADYYQFRGGIKWLAKRFDEALADHNLAIAMAPDNAEYYSLRAFVYEDMNEYEKAVADYTKNIALDPTDFRPLYDRGNAYLKLNKPDAACKDWKAALKLGDSRTDEINASIKKNCR